MTKAAICERRIPFLTPDQERLFWGRVTKSADHCWLWNGHLNRGYGDFRPGRKIRTRLKAHRVAFILKNGPIPEGMTIDHLCKVRCCVNPAHMEVVTQAVNCLRGGSPPSVNRGKTHCPRDHEYTPENTYVFPVTGKRSCRTCKPIWRAAHDAKKGMAAGAR